MMKLYGSLASPYVARVVLVARHKKLELPLEMPADGIKSPAYLAKNPTSSKMAVGVVDLLELVEVDEYEGEPRFVAGHQLELPV